MEHKVITGDCMEKMYEMQPNSVDLVFCSPPYEDARTYGIDFKIKGDDWVEWCVHRYMQCLRVCKGLVAWVVEGKTRNFRYSATPMLLMAELHNRGVHLRKPPIFHRVGIPGSGGPDWLRSDCELIVCATSGGKLPWSDNVAMGKPTKYDEGGACTNRDKNGKRIGYTTPEEKAKFGSHRAERRNGRKYAKPKKGIANPGNVIKCVVGGGKMGSPLAHENEAPFPEQLAEFFIRSFCPPDGIVLDPFSGSGTTAKVAAVTGRNSISIDIRPSQIELTKRRLQEVDDSTILNPEGTCQTQ